MKILLVCSAGMSTSMMVNKMKQSADERGIDAEIWAVADALAKTEMEKADIIMLGPQVRFLKDKLQEEAKDKSVVVIDMMAYGTMNGAKVLDQALEVLGK